MYKNIKIIEKVVADMGGSVKEFVPERDCFYINLKGKHILLDGNISINRQSFGSVKLTKCKEVTSKLLRANNLPTPRTECFYNKSFDKTQALKQLKVLKYPIIIKNAVGSNSRGVFTTIQTTKKAIDILKKELPRYHSMVAQEMVFGKEYRVLVLGEKVIGALEIIYPYIVGDGVHVVRSIIKSMQRNTEKKTKLDKKLIQTLKNQNVTLSTVLSNKKIINIKGTPGWYEGGESRDVTDLVNDGVKKICVAASKAVGKYLVGVDIICDDISKKPTKKSLNILEVNGKPHLYIHYEPTYGRARNVLKDILSFLVRK